MRAVIQRVKKGSVTVKEQTVGSIDKGLVVLLGISEQDQPEDIAYMVDKTVNLRIFEDSEGKMNLSLLEVGGELLVISQFTLYGDCRKGRRPSFSNAAKPEKAQTLYESYVDMCRRQNIHTETGIFQADMQVHIENDGPVTLIIDSEKIL